MADLDSLEYEGMFRPRGEPSLRWGVIGTGWIARQFTNAALRHTTQRIVAVGSRSAARSSEFAAEYGIDGAHGSYSALINDPAVEVVYVAVTADRHLDLALEAVAAGKPVLIEKPFALNGREAALIRDAARSAGVLVMEAMWTRYLPQFDAMRMLLARGVLGSVSLVIADHGQGLAQEPTSRLLRPDLGGGALLDLGVYPLALASEVFGTPSQIRASGDVLPTGVDGTVNVLLSYAATSAQAVVSTSMTVHTPTTAAICGSQARLEIDGPFYVPRGFTVMPVGHGSKPLVRWTDKSGIELHEGLSYQATALARFLQEGRNESPIFGLDESVSIMATIDAARSQIQSSKS